MFSHEKRGEPMRRTRNEAATEAARHALSPYREANEAKKNESIRLSQRLEAFAQADVANQDLAQHVGRSPAEASNRRRILRHGGAIWEMYERGELSYTAMRTLLPFVDDPARCRELARKLARRELTTKQVELMNPRQRSVKRQDDRAR
jgi:hypothetical protein